MGPAGTPMALDQAWAGRVFVTEGRSAKAEYFRSGVPAEPAEEGGVAHGRTASFQPKALASYGREGKQDPLTGSSACRP